MQQIRIFCVVFSTFFACAILSNILAIKLLSNVSNTYIPRKNYYYITKRTTTKTETIQNKTNTHKNTNTSIHKIALLHVGKTGGTTAKQMLQLYTNCNPIAPYETKRQIRQRKGRCKNILPQKTKVENDTKISLYVTGIYHEIPIVLEDLMKDYTSFLITTRHPIHRVISAYSYSNPSNYKVKIKDDSIYKCYLKPNEFFTNGLSSAPTTMDQCKSYALKALKGEIKSGCPHLYYNYKYYTDILSIRNNPPDIFIIRMEQFWQDWSSVNSYLEGDPKDIIKIPSKTHYEERNTSKSASNRTVSQEGIQNACRVLCEEIQIYKKLIERGVNLHDEDRFESLRQLNETCPIETKVNYCR